MCCYFPGPGCGPTHLDCVARGGGGFLWIPFKQQAHTNDQSVSVSPSCIIPFNMPPFQLILRALGVVCLNDARCSHWQNGTHATSVWIHTVVCLGTADVRLTGASVCVFFFLVICFGHSNVWCASTQQSHCHTHTLQTHTCLCVHTHSETIVNLPKLFHSSYFFTFGLSLSSSTSPLSFSSLYDFAASDLRQKITLFPTWKQVSASSQACKAEDNK